MSESVPKQDIDEILKEIGYNDSPLRKEVKQAFAKWLQQKQTYYEKKWHGEANLATKQIFNEMVRDLGK